MTGMINAPYIHTGMNGVYLCAVRLLSVVPLITAAVIFYGIRAAVLIMFCSAAFAGSDILFDRLRHSSRDSILNSLYCGALLALMLPPDTPLYIAFTGVLFACGIVRHLSGGKGSGFLSPVAMGRFIVRVLFPANEGALAMPCEGRAYIKSLVFGSEAYMTVSTDEYYTAELAVGRFPSFLGTSFFFLMLAALIYLIAKRAVKAYIPVSYFLMLFILMILRHMFSGGPDPVIFMITSGVMFTAAFLLNDDETIRPFGVPAAAQAFLCAFLTFVLSFVTAGIDLIVVPVLLTGALTGMFDYSEAVLRAVKEDRLRVKP